MDGGGGSLGGLAPILLGIAAAWAIVLLALEVRSSLGRRPKSLAVRSGSGPMGMAYVFTAGMLPWRKESISKRPVEFGLGILLHLGVAAAAVTTLGTLAGSAPLRPALAIARTGLLAAGLAAGVVLLARRAASAEMRRISVPDDYVASAAVALLLGVALGHSTGRLGEVPLQLVAALLLVDLPLGKLRHALFFFVARGDLGWRLGERGVLPPHAAERTGRHGR